MAERLAFSGPEHQPFALQPNGKHKAMLLLHGFLGTPAELRPLAERLAEAGWHAAGPLLPGFGPQVAQLEQYGQADWLAAAQQAWQELPEQNERRVLLGYSMGAALAICLAPLLKPDRLVLVAPFWRLPGWMPKLIPLARLFTPVMKPFEKADFDDLRLRQQIESIVQDIDLDDPATQQRVREEFVLPLSALHELVRLGRQAYRQARQVQVPALVLQGSQDQTVRPSDTQKLLQRLPAGQTTYRLLEAGHNLIQAGSPQIEPILEEILTFTD